MGLRGPKPRGKVRIKWSADFAYAIGLLAADGNLSKNGRHITFTSKDKEQLLNYRRCLELESAIGITKSGAGITYMRVQFGDVLFYRFLIDIGFTPAKSKTIGVLKVPEKYFFDFLRGSFDGDGSFYSYFDPRWKSSHMFYTVFISASSAHIEWLRDVIFEKLGVLGHISPDGRKRTLQLKYAKADSWKILKSMYYSDTVVCLSRKRLKIEKALVVEEKNNKRNQ